MFTHFGRPPTDFSGTDGQFTAPLIFISRDGGRTWGEEFSMDLHWEIDGFMSDGGKSVLRLQSGKVLFIAHRHGATYKSSGSHGIPAISESTDGGKTWSPARILTDEPEDIQYVMNHRLVQVQSGRLLLPISARDPRIPVEQYGEGVHPTVGFCYISDDDGATWRRSQGVVRQDTERGVQEPAVEELQDGRILMLFRSGLGCHQVSFSSDGGETWTDPVDTPLTAACSPIGMQQLEDGRVAVAYNHAKPLFEEAYFPRNPLTLTTTLDGHSWSDPITLDDHPGQQLIYPSLTPTTEGILVVYTAHYDPGDASFRVPPDVWKIGGGKRCMISI
jgi:hypothetical protein